MRPVFLLLCVFSAFSFTIHEPIREVQEVNKSIDTISINDTGFGAFFLSSDLLLPQNAMLNEAMNKHEDGIHRIQQKHQGVPVYGAEVVFEIENGQLISQNGRIGQVSLKSVSPKLSPSQAKAVVADRTQNALKAELIIYPVDGRSYLAWHLVEEAHDSQWNFFVDAKTAKLIDSFNNMNFGVGRGHDGVDVSIEDEFDSLKGTYILRTPTRATYDAKHNSSRFFLPGEIGLSEDGTWAKPALVDAHRFAGLYLKLLKKKFKRDSFDDKGAKVISTVHFGEKYNNAFWNGRQMVYGDGDGVVFTNLAGSLDVIAHEVTHALTQNTSNLVYRNESGALNESFSDIMAAYAEYVIQPAQFDWSVGEDVFTPGIEGDALRYMDDPTRGKNPNPPKGREWAYSRDHMDDKYSGFQDNGGVHLNSGIPNLAFYLLSEGGVHPRVGGESVIGIGIDKAINIAYLAFTTKLVPSSTFSDAKAAMIEAAAKLYDADTVSSVEAAWNAVGV